MGINNAAYKLWGGKIWLTKENGNPSSLCKK